MLGHARSDRDLDSYPPARPARPQRAGDGGGRGSGKLNGKSNAVRVATEGPYDSGDPAVARVGRTAGRVDFGSLRIPIPARAQLQVEKGTGELLRAVHVLVPSGRVSLSALAAPRSKPLWRGLSGEIADSLSADGARVRTQWGEWGREVEAGSNGALSRFIGVDGPRWMLYGVATGPADGAQELADVLREMMRKTVVYRGQDPLPVKTVLPLRLPEHLEENVERARDVSAQRPGKRDRPEADRSERSARSGTSRPAKRTDASRSVGSPGGAEVDPVKTPRRPADPPVPSRPSRPSRPAASTPRSARPPVTPPVGAPSPGEASSRYPGRAIGRPGSPVPPTTPPPGAIPAAAQLPGPGPAIGPLGGAGRPVDRHSPVPPAAFPAMSGHYDTDAGGPGRRGSAAFSGELPRHTELGGMPSRSWPTDGDGIGGRGAVPAYGSLPPISGLTDTGGLARPSGVEATWSLAKPVVNAAQVSQQPAWALLGDAPSFWPHERYQPGTLGEGPIEMSSVESSLPLEPVSPGLGYETPPSTSRDGFDDAPWAAERPPAGTGGAGEWEDSETDLLSCTDSLHAVLTHDSAVTRDWQARADRLGRHRSKEA